MNKNHLFAAIIVVLTLGLSACAGLLERSRQSGYADNGEVSSSVLDLYAEKRAHNESQAREELGLIGRSLSDQEQSLIEERVRLRRLESRLESKREIKQYFQIRPILKNDRERIFYLNLPSYEARERWARNRGMITQDEGYADDVAHLIEKNDIAIGMSQKAVLESWGDPDAVEVAGDSIYGNERWKYSRYVSGNEGFQKELRLVYFEGGRVVGWERL